MRAPARDPSPTGARRRGAGVRRRPALRAMRFALGPLVLGLLGCAGAAPLEPPPDAPPDVVFILYDDLHWDDLAAYGGTAIRTPNIDRLAAEGMRFTRFYSNSPVCSPARVALLTGLYPARLNVRSVLKKAPLLPPALLALDEVAKRPRSRRGIPAEVTTLPELLKARGYRTVHVGKWHAGDSRPEFRAPTVGFDHSVIVLGRTPGYYTDPVLWVDDTARWFAEGHSTDVITAAAIEAIEQADERPLFLNLWYPAPHEPLEPPDRWASDYPATDRGRFAAMVAHLDESVGRILDALEASGRGDNTLVLLSSDNGGVEDFNQASRLRGGKNTLYEGGVRIPLLARWPARVAAGSVSDSVRMGFDLAPTLAELAGLDPGRLEADGESFAGVLLGRATAPRTLFWEHRRPASRPDGSRFDQWAVLEGDLKLLFDGNRARLFDLATDSAESVDLASERPESVAELTAKYRRWRLETGRLRYGIAGAHGAVDTAVGAVGDPPGRASLVRASFRGAGAILLRPHPLFDFHDGDFTTGLWLKLAPAAPPLGLVFERRSAWRLGWDAGDRLQLRLWSEDGSVTAARAPEPLERGKWHHVAFTAGGTSLERRTMLRLYVDGREAGVARTPAAPASNREPVVVGGWQPCRGCEPPPNAAGATHFLGELADLRVYSMEMTAGEVAALAAEPPERSGRAVSATPR